MKEDKVILGNPILISWDKINNEDWITIRDAEDKVILKIQKLMWDSFTPETRDSIIDKIRREYG